MPFSIPPPTPPPPHHCCTIPVHLLPLQGPPLRDAKAHEHTTVPHARRCCVATTFDRAFARAPFAAHFVRRALTALRYAANTFTRLNARAARPHLSVGCALDTRTLRHSRGAFAAGRTGVCGCTVFFAALTRCRCDTALLRYYARRQTLDDKHAHAFCATTSFLWFSVRIGRCHHRAGPDAQFDYFPTCQ